MPFYPEEILCFVSKNQSGQYNFWDIAITDDDAVNYYIAKAFAVEYIEYVEMTADTTILDKILRAMPNAIGYVEKIFLNSIDEFICEGQISMTYSFVLTVKL